MPLPDRVRLRVRMGVKIAVQLLSADIVMEIGEVVPTQSPPQLVRAKPVIGVAVRVTGVPSR